MTRKSREIVKKVRKDLHNSKKSKQIFVVQSHSRANNKAFSLKNQINSIFIVNSLRISNICCTFAG